MTRPVLVYFSDVWLLELVKHATENKDIGSWDMSLKWRKWTKRSMNVTIAFLKVPTVQSLNLFKDIEMWNSYQKN